MSVMCDKQTCALQLRAHHGDQVLADGVVLVHIECQLELRPDPCAASIPGTQRQPSVMPEHKSSHTQRAVERR